MSRRVVTKKTTTILARHPMAVATMAVIENDAGEILTSRAYWSRHTGVWTEKGLGGPHVSQADAERFERERALEWFDKLVGDAATSDKTKAEARHVISQLKSTA